MAEALQSSDSLSSGSWYELLVPIGTGRMATVHLGRWRGAPGTAQLVAIKRLHPHLTGDPAAREAMLAEAAVGSRLRHPNVVGVHDVEDLGTELLVVMDYVEGASLAELLAQAPLLPRPVAVRIALDAAAGLGALHELVDERGQRIGAVHRDVAPDNLLVGLDGSTRVADFGVVKRPGAGEHPSQERIVSGRHAYMAPEYLMGYATDARADVFSLAVVVWELLAGKHPFRASTAAATMQRVARMEAPRLSSVAPHLGGAFDAVLGRALTKNPALRHASVGAFAYELASAAAWAGGIAEPIHVAATVEEIAGEALALRRADVEQDLWGVSGMRQFVATA